MEVLRYLGLVRKWGWLIALLTILAAIASYQYSRTLKPTYRATTTLIVGQALQNPNPSSGEFYIATQLAQAYTLLVKQQPILQATAAAVQWPGSWQSLGSQVSATTTGGQLIQINVTDTQPARAKQIAEEVARQLILQSPTGVQQKQAEEQRTFVNGQLTQLKTQIETSENTLDELTNQAALETDATKLQDLNTRISALQTKLDNWRKTYADLSSLLNTNSSNFLSVLAPAQEPQEPVSPSIQRNVLLAALAGLALAVAIIYLLEYLDNTLKDPDDLQRALNLPTLGAIARIGGIQRPSDHLVTVKQPRSPTAEAYRIFRTNLRFSGIHNPGGALLVTSSSPGEGKTTTAANLAVTLAQSGKRVILVDTDLRRPSIHKVFDLPNSVGLTNLFLDEAPKLDTVMQRTSIEGLRVLPSGAPPPNPAELLDSKLMAEIIANLQGQADMVIFDSPPVLAVADASIVGSRCTGAVLVVNAGKTRADVCRRALDTLKQTNVKVVGAVLNKLSSKRGSGYYYYHYNYASPEHKSGKKNA